MLFRTVSTFVAVLALVNLSPTASALLIDSFVDTNGGDQGNIVSFASTGGVADVRSPLAGVVGLERSVQANGVTYDVGASSGRRFEAAVRDDGSEAFTVESGTRAKGFGNLVYNEGGAGLGAGAGVDISDGGTSNVITFAYDTDVTGQNGNVCYALTLDDGTNSFTVTISSSATSGGGSGDTGVFFLNLFSAAGVDLTAITSILFEVEAKTFGADTNVQFLQSTTTVPEPSSLAIALTGLGMAGVYFRRRRKQMNA